MKKLISLLGMLAFIGSFSQALAIPELQLDIAGGTYNSSTSSTIPTPETIIASGDSFTLYTYLIPDINALDDTYFLSAAVIPRQAETTPAPSLGSFKLNGTTYNVTGDMLYGVPPVETLMNPVNANSDPGDLQDHGVFDTYFREFMYTFEPNKYIDPYNVQDRALAETPIVLAYTGQEKMYYIPFEIDVSGLAEGYGIHFDLYNSEIGKKDPLDLDISTQGNAPFSHDAEGWKTDGGAPPQEQVPEPGTIALVGLGLAAIGLYRRGHRG